MAGRGCGVGSVWCRVGVGRGWRGVGSGWGWVKGVSPLLRGGLRVTPPKKTEGFWGGRPAPSQKRCYLIQQNIKHIIGHDYQLLLLSKSETRQCYLIQQNIKHIIGHVFQLLLLSKTVRVTQFNKI